MWICFRVQNAYTAMQSSQTNRSSVPNVKDLMLKLIVRATHLWFIIEAYMMINLL